MNTDERIARPTERHEALTQSIELLTRDSALRAARNTDAENITQRLDAFEARERQAAAAPTHLAHALDAIK